MFLHLSTLLTKQQKQYLIDISILNQVSYKLVLDKSSYFVIKINSYDKIIKVEQCCFNNRGQLYFLFFKDKTAKSLCHKILTKNHLNIILSSNHAAYLGRELIKSELAILLDQKYIQD